MFASRDIEDVTIPSYIKRLNSFSFQCCKKLKSIFESSIENFTIIKSIETIGKYSSFYCPQLKKVTIEKGSKLQTFVKYLFYNCQKLEEIANLEESQIKSFKIKSLAETSLKKFGFPPSLEKLQERWCGMNEMLNEIVISPDNQNFKFTDEYIINSIPKLECLEDKPKMIVSKSDNQNFDTIIFASRNIEEAAIPSYIKYIHDNAFELCMNLSVFLIPEDSQLKSIGKHAFALTSISSLYFPSDLEELGKGWCESMSDLLFIEISPDNNNFKFADFEEKLIIGKSDKNKEEFDLLVIACRYY